MKTSLTHFVPAAILGVGVLLISGIREQFAVKPDRPMSSMTKTFAGHVGRDVTISAEEQRVAGMTDYSMREYGPDSMPLFTTYVGYYDRQVQGKAIHSPKNCLPGAGWDILTSARIPAPSNTTGATVNRVLLANRGTRALVYYWYQGRGRVASSEYLVKWNLLRDAALLGRTEEALVRIVVPLPRSSGRDAEDVVNGDRIARLVAVQLEAEVNQMLPKISGE